MAKEKYQKQGRLLSGSRLWRDFPRTSFSLRSGQKLGPDFIMASDSLPCSHRKIHIWHARNGVVKLSEMPQPVSQDFLQGHLLYAESHQCWI